MGGIESMERSRARDLRPDVDKNRREIILSWQNKSHCGTRWSQNDGKPTLTVETLEKAGRALRKHFGTRKLSVLEVFAGNCVAGQVVYNYLRVSSWLYTDIEKYHRSVDPFNQLDCVDAVRLFGPRADLLLMISPPYPDEVVGSTLNHGYGDYYACKDFIDQTDSDKKKHIVFIGELGASDGSPGVYKYLLQHRRLKLSLRHLIYKTENAFGPLEKELFVFDII